VTYLFAVSTPVNSNIPLPFNYPSLFFLFSLPSPFLPSPLLSPLPPLPLPPGDLLSLFQLVSHGLEVHWLFHNFKVFWKLPLPHRF